MQKIVFNLQPYPLTQLVHTVYYTVSEAGPAIRGQSCATANGQSFVARHQSYSIPCLLVS